jgi:hypothetical protein
MNSLPDPQITWEKFGMAENIFNSIFVSQNPQIIIAAVLTAFISYLPRFIAAVIVFLLGKMIANYVASGLVKIIDSINLKKVIESFELGVSIPASSQRGLAQIISILSRYIILYFTLILTFELLGLVGVSVFLKSLAGVLPKIISAIFIILLGVIAAGIVETLIKKAFLEIDPATARLSGKIASYVVITFFVLMSLAEIGVASFFINTLFIGFVAAISLALGLSIGLGSKDVVSQTLDKWHKSRSKKK